MPMSPANPSAPEDPPPITEPFRLGAWVVSPATGEIASEGKVARLEPKAMDLLVYLASRAGAVVSRQELEAQVWRGALVGYDAITGTVIKLRKALGDRTREPRYIATIPKRGYQLIAPVSSVEEQEPTATAADREMPSSPGRKRPRSRWSIVATLVVVAVALAALTSSLYVATTRPPAGPRAHPPSVVVLPFVNLSEDPQQDGFADGMTEDLVTDLSRLSDLRVLASNTSFAFKGKEVTAQQVGKELGVDYVLQGSLRRRDDALRINAQLVDARSGFQRWAERYDRPAVEVFNVQDEVTGEIVKALAVNLTRQEAARLSRRSTNNLAAYDRFQEGQRLSRVFSKATNRQAATAYRQAIALDPSYGRAYGALAYTLAADYRRGWTDTPQLTSERALELAKKAVALDGSIPQTYWALGYVHLMRRELAQAEAAVRQALTIAPNYADGYGLLALIKNAQGEPQAALAAVEKGMRLNPNYTWDYPYNQGRAYYTLGRIDVAITALEAARSRNANAVPVRLHLAAAYARAGRLDDAEWEVQELLAMSPTDTLSQLRNAHPTEDPQSMAALIEDLRKAGLPE